VSDRSGGVRDVEIGRIRPNPAQPRINFDEKSIAELAESIAQRGVLQPVLLRPDGENYQLLPARGVGERRSGRGCTASRRSFATSTIRLPPRSR
jgi:ParB family transcriptional regulator, chromosome partitioning protein